MHPLLRAAAFILLTLAGCAPPGAQFSATDAAAIRASEDAWLARVKQGDWPGVAAFYTPTATFMPPNQPAVEGRPSIEAWMRAFPPISDFSITTLEVDGRDDLAYVRGTYALTFTPPGAAQPVTDRGKYLEVRRKQADGSWPMIADIFNSDLPLK